MISLLSSLNSALHRALSNDERVLLMGEDILDPYGGAFKVTRGLSSAFPERVLAAPISEAGMVGLAVGLALRGLRPVVEIMFGDFTLLAADQLINHAGKLAYMYNDQVSLPLVVRTPMGGRRGYGPTHSQTIEKHFMGAPGLGVAAPCNLLDGAGELLYSIISRGTAPMLFVENKLQYLLPVLDSAALTEFVLQTFRSDAPIGMPGYVLNIRGAPPPVLTIAAYGYMAELARQAQLRLAYEDELFCELVIFTQLSPFSLDPLLASAARTGRLLAVEEGTLSLGWGAELLAQTAEALGSQLVITRRLAARDLPVPAALFMEQAVLPGIEEIIRSAKKMV
jgi:pyruvate/2-oxoglutarate/acetoin dehydrogenase E1 component